MRASETVGALTAQAIAGTHVVLFGMSVQGRVPDDFVGFSIERLDHSNGTSAFLDNFVLFEQNDRGAASDHSGEGNPFQGFVWGDYTAQPDRKYTFRISPRHGPPDNLRNGDTVELAITTESIASGEHSIFFNRGAASSQAYAIKFPELLGKRPSGRAWAWLSRGLEEALLDFIGTANGPGWALRAAIYEFQYEPVLKAFGASAQAGADVKIVWDGIDNSEPAKGKRPAKAAAPATENSKAITAAGIEDLCIQRQNSSYIAHNKFIVLLRDGEPEQVWTGSTNLTDGGIYGHSNVGHLLRNPGIAAHYLDYWNVLAKDPAAEDLKNWTLADTRPPDSTPEQLLGQADPLPPDRSIGTVFSPRHGVKALEWYAQLMDGAGSSVFLTAAFGVSKELQAIFAEKKPYLRYLMLDNRDGKIETVARGIETDPNNRVVAGAYVGEGKAKDGWHQWVAEALTGLNGHVQFIHTKYMLIDPLGDDPIVITGSANFSDASTSANDENMLVIRGNTRVADVYLGEFMRLFSHFRLRGRINAGHDKLVPAAGIDAAKLATETKYLKEDSSWATSAYVKDSPEEKERLLFSGSAMA
jgi:phosphatidylserine/phosphatidylglycerophosphate/cardiolipin synthase-like enzyme